MTVTCSKCGNANFVLASVVVEGATETPTILQCGACGHAVGVSDDRSLRAALGEQQANLNDLRRQMSEVLEMLGKLSTTSQG